MMTSPLLFPITVHTPDQGIFKGKERGYSSRILGTPWASIRAFQRATVRELQNSTAVINVHEYPWANSKRICARNRR
jgi:hypothetical protein